MSPKSTKKASPERKCVFCNLHEDNELIYGKMYEHSGIVTHYYCLLLSSNMQQRGRDEDGILGFLAVDIQKEVRRGRKLTCSYCKKNGATLGCCNRKCKRVFHYPCGIKNNTLHQFYGQYKSFCDSHRPKQNIDNRICNDTPEHPLCYICYDHVHRENFYQTLWAPCCKKNAWFHRDCVQQLALSAGYFFKCPLCNNKKEFQKAMLESGIFIPSQDASWELVPNAFQELLYRHNKCDAEKCICPNGREHASNNARWELILCRTCGSQGIHMGCGNLRWIDPEWDCEECSSILNKSGKYHNSNHGKSVRGHRGSIPLTDESSRESNGDSSDSEVSVGRELPLTEAINSLNRAEIILKPGPRSAKLKQLEEHEKMKKLTNLSNEQQPHNSTPSKMPLSSPIENSSLTPTASQKPENITSGKVSSETMDDVIIVDSDDDDVEVIKSSGQSLTNDKTLTPNNISNRAISYMNIKISDVTSIQADVFASVPDNSLTSTSANEIPLNTLQADPSTYLLKRKADSSDIVSMIVQRINDSIDSPDISKKLRIENNENFNTSFVSATTLPVQLKSSSVLKGYNNKLYRNGISMDQTAIVTVNGKEFVVPLDNPPSSAPLSNTDQNPSQLNSDRDAGTTCAEFMYQLDDNENDSIASTESSGGGGYADYGKGEDTNDKYSDSESCSSWDSDAGIDRDRLMPEKVSLRDLKFYVYKNNTITVNYCDKLSMNISVDTKRDCKTVNNSSFFCIENNSKWASRVRGSNVQFNNNRKVNDCSFHSGTINESVILGKRDRASDIKNTRLLLSKDSTHYLANSDKNHLYKYERKEAAKENLVPDIFEQSNNIDTDKLTSPGRVSRRFWHDNNNDSTIATSRKYINSISVTSDPGTSRDELRELSHSNVNQRYFTSASSINAKTNRTLMTYRCKSFSSYFNEDNIRCRVSIDLNRIQSIFPKIPNFVLKKNNNTIKCHSFHDLRVLSENNEINDCKLFGLIRRSKSEGNIPSIHNNSTKNFDNYVTESNMMDLHKRKKARRKKPTDKHACVR